MGIGGQTRKFETALLLHYFYCYKRVNIIVPGKSTVYLGDHLHRTTFNTQLLSLAHLMKEEKNLFSRVNDSSESECRSYPSPLIHPLDVPLPASGYQGSLASQLEHLRVELRHCFHLPMCSWGNTHLLLLAVVSQHITELLL